MIEILIDSIHLPHKVWNQLLLSIYSLNKIEMKNERQLTLLQQCCFRVFNPGSHEERPNYPVIKIGLETAECMNDPQLATSILLWSMTTKSEAKQGGPRTVAATVPESNKVEENSRFPSYTDKYNHVSPDALLRGLKLCVHNDRADLADQIWTLVKTEQYDLILPKELRSELQTMMITSYAKGGQLDKAENVLQEMRDQGTLFRYVIL
jgi:pentatricopeptide repeat protein